MVVRKFAVELAEDARRKERMLMASSQGTTIICVLYSFGFTHTHLLCCLAARPLLPCLIITLPTDQKLFGLTSPIRALFKLDTLMSRSQHIDSPLLFEVLGSRTGMADTLSSKNFLFFYNHRSSCDTPDALSGTLRGTVIVSPSPQLIPVSVTQTFRNDPAEFE
ncbi:hypothetical protein C8J57DRAFT_197079 [Mycena rebaudengoi]|nr:hypothetical protein C8J57DRAFT_197079 [Mycena rebaudengoi]